MAKKKQQSVLGLPPLPPLVSGPTPTSLAISTSTNALTRRETQIFEASHEHKVLIRAIDDKTRFGIETINETKWFAVADVWYTMQQIEEVRQEAQGTNCQAALDEFSTYLINLSARHTLGMLELSAGKIAEVVSESVEPPEPLPDPPKGFLARLLGWS